MILSACNLGTQSEATIEDAPTVAEESVAENNVAEEVPSERTASGDSAMADASSLGLVTFQITPAESEARFYIDEDLRGNPITVVGVTSSINGEIFIDPATPANTQVGPITIDAASFVTDSDRRDGAIRRFVLGTDSYPTITFVPTEVTGLPAAGAVGTSFDFQVTGDLTLKDQTRSETFAVTLSTDSASQISGMASATIVYADYGIFIPDVPFVANVGDELKLEFEFVAVGDAVTTGSTGEAPAEVVSEAAAPAAADIVPVVTKLNLNVATGDEYLASIPDFSSRMVREFLEYRPYISIQEFRREMGKYIDDAQIAGYEAYVYVPINVNESDEATVQQIPGIDAAMAADLVAARPYESNAEFLAGLSVYLSNEEVAVAAGLLSSE